MTTQSDTLKDMANNADSEAETIDVQIEQLDKSIDDYNTKIDAVENGQCAVAEDNLTGYLDGTKLVEIETLYGTGLNTPFSVSYGPNYGIIDYVDGGIIDFEIIDSTGNTMYSYEGVNWDSDATIVKLLDDYSYSNDYLTRPLDSGATYGLIPNRDSLLSAKGILENNREKIIESKEKFSDYAS